MITAKFTKELEQLLNAHSIDSLCNTPDFLLAQLLTDFLDHLQRHNRAVSHWKGEQTNVVTEIKRGVANVRKVLDDNR